MKAKVFSIHPRALEKELGAWLFENPVISIKFVSQSQTDGGTVTLTVFYFGHR